MTRPMDAHTLVRAAARNNAEWCDIVCRTHGVTGQFGATAWTSARRPPPYYPDAVTLEVGASPSAILPLVDTSTPGCSIKDSFMTLDLTAADFQVLFEAEWIYREHALPRPDRPVDLHWAIVRDDIELRRWEAAWRDQPTPNTCFRPALLALENVAVMAAYDGDAIVAGAIASRSGCLVGISNVFDRVEDFRVSWAGTIATASGQFPGCSLVGYESGTALAAAREEGFASIGPLRVWHQSPARGASAIATANTSEDVTPGCN